MFFFFLNTDIPGMIDESKAFLAIYDKFTISTDIEKYNLIPEIIESTAKMAALCGKKDTIEDYNEHKFASPNFNKLQDFSAIDYMKRHKDEYEAELSLLNKCNQSNGKIQYINSVIDWLSYYEEHSMCSESFGDATVLYDRLMNSIKGIIRYMNEFSSGLSYKNEFSSSLSKNITAFISYKSEESEQSEKIKKYLEEQGICCWRAPESIRPGKAYADVIAKAIEDCDAFVLCLSPKSLTSDWILREVQRASDLEKTIIPFAIEKIDFKKSGGIGMIIQPIQIISAYEDFDGALKKLSETLNSVKKEK